mmetsp:Transcript_27867/g.96297  ORF Transcript_27867/g.96297 Transcript_27867/m.96297 type:complete len:458 (-) Transcript_27867:261-1634(-)
MVAMDDFLTFKKLMVRRNAELAYEALKAMQDRPIVAPASDGAALDGFLAAAKETDLSGAEREKVLRGAEKAESKDSSGEFAAPGDEYLVDADLKAKMDEELRAMELLHQEEEIEQLELEEAIAESLAVEQARIDMELQMTIAASVAERKTEADDAVRTGPADKQLAKAPAAAAEPRLAARPVARALEAAAKDDAPAPRAASSQPAKAIEMDAAEAAFRAYDSNTPKSERAAPRAPTASKSSLSGLAPLPMVGGRSAAVLGSLPSLAELQDQMRVKRKNAEETFRKNQELLREQNAQKKEMQASAGVTPEDMARRKQQLKEQRDFIVAQKKAARMERASKERADLPSGPIGEKLREEAKGSPVGDPAADAAKQRALMSKALARRFKQDLVESQHDRLKTMEAQTTELDDKLRTVLELRLKNREKELQLQAAIEQHQQQRFKNIQLSVAREKSKGGGDF